MKDSLTISSPTVSSPLACCWARRALVPVPHGDRSNQPGWIAIACREWWVVDPGASRYTRELQSAYQPAKGFKGPVVEIVGEFDQLHCANDIDVACVASVLQVSEKPYWPDSRDLRVVVRAGSGHDLNLDFGAAETFRLYSTLAQTLV